MTERLEAARSIRIGAARLRRLAKQESNEALASEIIEIAAEMDHYAAILEGSFARNPPSPANDDEVA